MNRTIEIITTEDGSNSLFFKELDETYHSTHGAIQESNHVFIKSGLAFLMQLHGQKENSTINILEIGFGTGLNAMLTLEKSLSEKQQLNYTTFEPFPIPLKVIEKLNYFSFFDKKLHQQIQELHFVSWNKIHKINTYFTFEKKELGLENLAIKNQFDLVYFDAFAPNKQAEMWELEMLENIFFSLKKEGILVTYCAKGVFRRLLQSLGFEVERIPGPPGKREMIRAVKK